ncbi:MAG TPA: hypothetical protein VIS29_16140 [Streptomyces sp.]|jgi:hypothetical protein
MDKRMPDSPGDEQAEGLSLTEAVTAREGVDDPGTGATDFDSFSKIKP